MTRLGEPAVLGLGSNVGDRRAHLRAAAEALRGLGSDLRVSSLFETGAVGPVPQPPFLNAVVVLDTPLPPRALLERSLAIERERGRVRDVPGGPRPLDIDLIFYGSRIVREPGLTVPHPRWKERAFVCVPMTEVEPNLIDPESGWRVEEWRAHQASGESDVVSVEGPEWAS